MDYIKLSREDLYELVWSKPMSHIAPKLGISDRGLGKTCTRLDIPVPGRGYWQKLKKGLQVEKEDLPSCPEGSRPYASFPGPYEKPEPIVLPEAGIEKKAQEYESRENNRIIVPNEIHRYHPLVKGTLDSLLESIWQKQGIYEAHGGKVLDLSCTKECAPRAARIYQTLIQNLMKRGFTIRVDSGRSGVEMAE